MVAKTQNTQNKQSIPKQFPGFLARFALRWFVCSLGLWIAAGLFSNSVSYDNRIVVVVVAGLILAAINAVIKPILVLASLPVILMTLGLFMVVVNGLTVWLASVLYKPFEVSSFWAAIGTGLVIGLVNYLVTAILEERQ
ncbi:phage holin family protein [Candidatus Saccharibacteria bacterium]|nr:MAG: phage holin family protein [Candidatus Saccharibacteria bacterium]